MYTFYSARQVFIREERERGAPLRGKGRVVMNHADFFLDTACTSAPCRHRIIRKDQCYHGRSGRRRPGGLVDV